MSDPLRRAGIEAIIAAANVASRCVFVNSREDLLTHSDSFRGCVLLAIDLDVDEVGAFELMARMRLRAPSLPILAFDLRPGADRAVRALRSGARGVVGDGATREKLVEAVSAVAAGRRYLDGDAIGAVLDVAVSGQPEPLHHSLSNREYETLCLYGAGKRAGVIARELALSPKTVNTYRARLLEKLNVGTTAELIRYAITHGLTSR
ncbi:response regulator transcription factor [Burkholderia sp. R-70006]|nr:response regulator transcription factor [Burkholderia sp. R-70006]